MPKLIFLPNEEHCPEGAVIEVEPGVSICDAALQHGIEIEHACEKSCACTTCHVYVREGMASLNDSTEDEDDMLDKAWGLEPDSRLSRWSGSRTWLSKFPNTPLIWCRNITDHL